MITGGKEREEKDKEEKKEKEELVETRRTVAELDQRGREVVVEEVTRRAVVLEAARRAVTVVLEEVTLAQRCFRSLFKLALSFHCIKTRPYQQNSNAILYIYISPGPILYIYTNIYVYIIIYVYILVCCQQVRSKQFIRCSGAWAHLGPLARAHLGPLRPSSFGRIGPETYLGPGLFGGIEWLGMCSICIRHNANGYFGMEWWGGK